MVQTPQNVANITFCTKASGFDIESTVQHGICCFWFWLQRALDRDHEVPLKQMCKLDEEP